MLKLEGTNIYLSVLEREHCQLLWNEFEYDFIQRTELLNVGHSKVKADAWFDEIQRDQGDKHIRLGIFTLDGTVVGDIALQDLEWQNRACTIGIGVSKLSNRLKGYSHEALEVMLGYAFHHLGLEKISATTLEPNIGCQKLLEKSRFKLEGCERQAVFLESRRWNRLHYGLLRQEFLGIENEKKN